MCTFSDYSYLDVPAGSMRVLEKEVTYSMGKKNKHKLSKHKENEISDSSEDIGKFMGCVILWNILIFRPYKRFFVEKD